MLFCDTVSVPQGLSIDALTQPIHYQLFHKVAQFVELDWAQLKTAEFEIRFGTFMCMDNNQKTQVFGERRRFGESTNPQEPRAPAPGLSQDGQNQPTQRWMSKMGFMPQPRLLAPKTFLAKMCLPSRMMFEKAKYILDQEYEKESKTSRFTEKSASNTCDFKLSRQNVRITMDLETLKPKESIDKNKMGNLDFGIALSPVDLRVAFAIEKQLDASGEEGKERSEKALDYVLKTYFGKEDNSNSKKNDGANASSNNDDQQPPERVDKRKKNRVTYTFTIDAPMPETPPEAPANTNPQVTIIEHLIAAYFPIGGIKFDLTHVVMNDKVETLELEAEWDMEKAVAALDAEINSPNNNNNNNPQLELIKQVRDALVLYDKTNIENTTGEKREEISKTLSQQRSYRKQFLYAGFRVFVKNAVAMAMSLKNEKVVVPTEQLAPAIRSREE